jgi:hypothetical protein
MSTIDTRDLAAPCCSVTYTAKRFGSQPQSAGQLGRRRVGSRELSAIGACVTGAAHDAARRRHAHARLFVTMHCCRRRGSSCSRYY